MASKFVEVAAVVCTDQGRAFLHLKQKGEILMDILEDFIGAKRHINHWNDVERSGGRVRNESADSLWYIQAEEAEGEPGVLLDKTLLNN